MRSDSDGSGPRHFHRRRSHGPRGADSEALLANAAPGTGPRRWTPAPALWPASESHWQRDSLSAHRAMSRLARSRNLKRPNCEDSDSAGLPRPIASCFAPCRGLLRRVAAYCAVSRPIAPNCGLLRRVAAYCSRRIAAHCVRANASRGMRRSPGGPDQSESLRGRASATRLSESKRHPSRHSACPSPNAAHRIGASHRLHARGLGRGGAGPRGSGRRTGRKDDGQVWRRDQISPTGRLWSTFEMIKAPAEEQLPLYRC